MSQISTDGALARTVEDAALMVDVMSGIDASDPEFLKASQPERLDGLRVAATTELGWPTPCEPEIAAAVGNAVTVLRDAGADVAQTSPPIRDPNEIFPTLSAVGAAANYGPLCIGREDELSDYTRGSLKRGLGLSGVQVAEAYAKLDRLQRQMNAWFEDFDILLTPTSAIPAHEHGARIDEIAGRSVSPWTISILYTPARQPDPGPRSVHPVRAQSRAANRSASHGQTRSRHNSHPSRDHTGGRKSRPLGSYPQQGL